MIVSYETFRIHAERFGAEDSEQLVMCDEAHRLKNGDTLTNKVRSIHWSPYDPVRVVNADP
jgi:hypothetical protein